MPDRFEINANKLSSEDSQLLSAHQNGLSDKLLLEAALLTGGAGGGFVKRVQEAWQNPTLTAIEFGGAAGLAAGMKLMSDAGGAWGKAAHAVGTVVLIAGGADAANRLFKTGSAMADTWTNPQNYEANKETVGRYLGSAFFDYPLLAAGGYAGVRGTEFGVGLKNKLTGGTKLSSSELVSNRAADMAAAAEVKFGEIAQVVHSKLRMAQFELPSAGYQPLFAADGASLPKPNPFPRPGMPMDSPAPKPLLFDAAKHPSLLASEAFPRRALPTDAPQIAREINFNIPALEALMAKRSTVVVVPILPLSFLPRHENKAETSTAASALHKNMEFKMHSQDRSLSRRVESFKLDQASFESSQIQALNDSFKWKL